MCGCGKNTCNKCETKVCHPCYDTLVNSCSEPCDNTQAQPIDCLTQEYCSEGCDSFIDAKCILFSDGETLETKITNIETLLTQLASCICDVTGGCPDLGTPTSGQICV